MKKNCNICLTALILFFLSSCSNKETFRITGETNYAKSESESLVTSVSVNYKFKINKFSNEKIHTYLSGSIDPQYDHFLNEVRVNTFTGINIEF